MSLFEARREALPWGAALLALIAGAGQAIAIKIMTGITVQIISTVVLSWKEADLAPFDLRWA